MSLRLNIINLLNSLSIFMGEVHILLNGFGFILPSFMCNLPGLQPLWLVIHKPCIYVKIRLPETEHHLAGHYSRGLIMKATIQPVKGTRDFYPAEMARRNWLYTALRQVSQSFGYQEYDGPFLERIDLYAAKSGEELVKEQSFVLQDRGGDWLTLRPELTPSLARMVAARQNELAYPLRWWSFGPFWRYERPQKGRTREFFQWNIDLVGAASPEADAELIAVCAALFKSLGLTPAQVKIKVNDRRLMDAELNALGLTAETRKTVFRVLDRRDKLSPPAWEAYALESGFTPTQLAGVKAMMADGELWRKSPQLGRVFTALQAMGLSEYAGYSPEVIRGLDYYTGTVFEAFDLDGGRAILGGGRYDNLVGDVGGDPLCGVGFAMGDVVILLVLEKYGLLPPLRASPAEVLVTVFDETCLAASMALAAELRRAGLKVVCYPEPAKLPRQLKLADRLELGIAVIQGPDEEAAGQVTIKDLRARTQQTVARAEAAAAIKRLI
jgi:histidyl-tRNA synthetase